MHIADKALNDIQITLNYTQLNSTTLKYTQLAKNQICPRLTSVLQNCADIHLTYNVPKWIYQ